MVQQRKLPIYEQGLSLFRSGVVQHADVAPRVQRLLLASVRSHRSGAALDVALMRSVLSMLVDLAGGAAGGSGGAGGGASGVYGMLFEAPLLAESGQFFHDESREVLARSTAPEYCAYAERRLAEERARADAVMHGLTTGRLLSLVECKLVAEHALALIDAEGSGLAYQLEHDRYEDMGRLYRLTAASRTFVAWRPPAELINSERDRERTALPVTVLKDSFKALVMRRGLALLFDAEAAKDPVKLIASLLDARDKYARAVEAGFNGDRAFQLALKEVRHSRCGMLWRLSALHRSCHSAGLRLVPSSSSQCAPVPPIPPLLEPTPAGLRERCEPAGGGPPRRLRPQPHPRGPRLLRGRAAQGRGPLPGRG